MRRHREDTRRHHRALPALTLAVVASALVAACGRTATPDECAAMLDRYVELSVRRELPRASAADVAAEQARSRERARTNESFRRCPTDVRERHVVCAMKAPDVDEFEKCLE